MCNSDLELNNNHIKLHNNDRVAVIGAGPAGSLFAYFLLRFARKRHLRLNVTLYDPSDFTRPGPAGCNGCVGVINDSLYRHFQRIGIDLEQTQGLIQSRLSGYLWNTPIGCQRIDVEDRVESIRTIFRGGGPRFGVFDENVSFDGYLLRQAMDEGAQHEQLRVQQIERLQTTQQLGMIRLTLEKDGRKSYQDAHLVVGAFGLNPFLMQQFEQLGIGFRRPWHVRAAQIELHRREHAPVCPIDDYIRVFNISETRVRQLVLTPKGRYATLTLLAGQDMSIEDLHEIRQSATIENIWQSGWDWPKDSCHCLPLLQKGSAKNFYGDRVALIGDAGCCRYFKNGLESALRTAEMVAKTAIFHGISRQAFRRWYFRVAWREIISDNLFGRVLLGAHNWISSHPRLMHVAIETRSEVTRPDMARRHQDILWNMLTGNRSYRYIFYQVICPPLALDTCMRAAKVLSSHLRQNIHHLRGRLMLRKQPSIDRKKRLYDLGRSIAGQGGRSA